MIIMFASNEVDNFETVYKWKLKVEFENSIELRNEHVSQVAKFRNRRNWEICWLVLKDIDRKYACFGTYLANLTQHDNEHQYLKMMKNFLKFIL
jgi:hypothetical protein